MITWMQRHKKWLVITIWISTIAFVGAGFVGWGSYDYGKKGGVVAVVGDREVLVEEYQQEYSNLYNQYSRMFGNSFNEELANKLNLKDVAYRQVLQKNLILSYGDTLGLGVTDEDIAKQLIKYPAFLKDGKFDKKTYQKVLNQNRTTIQDFEDGLKRDILLGKIQSLFQVKPNEIELENLNKLLFVKDDITFKIIDSKDIKIDVKEDELKSFWEKNKNSYMSEVQYTLDTTKVPLLTKEATDDEIKKYYDKFKNDYKKSDGKIKSLEEASAEIKKDLNIKATKKEALKKYLKIKKGQEKLLNTNTYVQSKLPFSNENITKIISSKVGKVIKPILENNEYLIIKLVKKIDAKPLSFELAKDEAKKEFIIELKAKKLDEIAKNQVKNFKGTQVKNVTRESINKISGLSPQESAQFLKELFSSTTKESFVKLNNKVVLYKIDGSNLADYDKSKDETVKATLSQLQEQELMNNLLRKLENTFEIKSSINAKE